MTTPNTPGPDRTVTAAILRAVADLIETSPDIPEPGIRISYYLHGQQAAGLMMTIAGTLPCRWQPKISRSSSGDYEWLDLRSTPEPQDTTRGTRVTLSTQAENVCVPAGAKTVTVWQPGDALAALVGTDQLGEVA